MAFITNCYAFFSLQKIGDKFMKIKIAGQEYKLHFGVAFIRELDEIFNTDMGGMSFGTGVAEIWTKLETSNPYVLFQALHAALNQDIDLTEEDFDDFIESFKSDEQYLAFFGKLKTELETARQTGNLIAEYKKNLQQLMKMGLETAPEKVVEINTKK